LPNAAAVRKPSSRSPSSATPTAES
jgi:hypothetical protein